MAKTPTRVWAERQLRELKDLEAHFPEGKLVLFPIVRQWGDTVYWDARVYGHWAGVLPPTKESLLAIGVPEEEVQGWLDKTERALSALRRLYPSAIPELVERLKELEAKAPDVLPAGEGE